MMLEMVFRKLPRELLGLGGRVHREGENVMIEASPDLVALSADNCLRVSCSQ
jgi:hypothetical protein